MGRERGREREVVFFSPHPADGEEQPGPPRADASETVSQPPVEQVLRDEGEDGEAHGRGQHVEDARHVVHVQLAGHDLVLLVVADPSQPLGLQLLHLAWEGEGREGRLTPQPGKG